MGHENEQLGLVVAALHTLLVAYIVVGPFVLPARGCLLLQYLFVLVFLVLHWITSNDTCALSMMESSLRGIEIKDTFVHSVVSPVYKMQWSANGYTIIGLLFVVALARAIHAGRENFELFTNWNVGRVPRGENGSADPVAKKSDEPAVHIQKNTQNGNSQLDIDV